MYIFRFKSLIFISLLVLSAQIKTVKGEFVSSESYQNNFEEFNAPDNKQVLNLSAANNKIKHVFHITLSKKDFKKLSNTTNLDRNYISNCTLTYNTDTLSLKKVELRGKSSMRYKRKSFSISLNQNLAITKNDSIHKLKKFNLICLSMDQNYYRNKIAFDLMNQIGLYHLFYTYAEVIINGKTQGIYLMLEKPKNYAFKQENSNVMLRRDFEHTIKKIYCKNNDSALIEKCKKTFSDIYDEILQKNDEHLYDELSSILDVEQYLMWMAFNFFIGNADYTDEVFFFNIANGDSIRFGIIPWDYDDILYDQPHEGYLVRHINFGDKLAFSSEDDLDFKLITNDYTYTKYLNCLISVMKEISMPVLKNVFEATYHELYPFYCRNDIMKTTRTDKYGKTNLKILETDMQLNFSKLIQKREKTLNLLVDSTSSEIKQDNSLYVYTNDAIEITSQSTDFINILQNIK